jgi:2-succinyl-5-enolpyruvyl-6-hydroxy-3-cyclohexene-1-carboxylate synthase
LIAITADRPPELRDCASGQTVDQQKLFGGFATFFHELAVPEARVELLQYLRQTLRHAVERARSGGPVHLNAPFRDPLPPVADGTAAGLAAAVDWERFFALPPVPPQAHPREQMFDREFAAAPGVIVCGAGWGEEVETVFWAERLGWPILADALSPLRFRGAGGRAVIAAYDAILRDPRAARALRPQSVLILGEIPTSKALRAWLTEADADTIQIGRTAENRDGRHGRTLRIAVGAATLNRWTLPHGVTPAPEWLAAWTRAEAAAQAVLAGAGELEGFEGGFTRTLANTLRRGQALFVASSMPVRDLESLAPARGDGPAVFANRGANGIDGTLSTALGVAHGGAPTVLLTGDLAFLHDTNGLLSAAKLKGSLTVVVINNAGGGIFGHLPIAAFNPPFEEYWATPQRVDFGRLCAAYDVPHESVATAAELAARLGALVGAPGLRVLEVRTDRARDVEARRDLFARAARAAGEAWA